MPVCMAAGRGFLVLFPNKHGPWTAVASQWLKDKAGREALSPGLPWKAFLLVLEALVLVGVFSLWSSYSSFLCYAWTP